VADKQNQSVDGEHPDTIEELVTTNPADETAAAEPEKGTAPAEEDGGDVEGLQAQLDSAQEKLVGAKEDANRKSTRLNSSHANYSYAVFCWNKKKDAVTQRCTKY